MINYHIFKIEIDGDTKEEAATAEIKLSELQFSLLIGMIQKYLCKDGIRIIPMVQAELIEEKLKELL